MEYNYRTVPAIFLYVFEYLFAIQFLAVIACDQIVHYDSHIVFDGSSLFPTYQSVWRPEQRAVDELVGFLDVGYIALCCHDGALYVVHGVVADAMSSADNIGIDFGMLSGVVADTEECCFYAVGIEQIQNPRCHFRNRAIVECKEGNNIL